MNLSKYSTLYERIPNIKTIVEKYKLSKKQIQCLNIIYDFYKNPNNKNNKIELREKLKKQRFLIPPDIIKKKSLLLNKKIINSKEYKSANTIFCYVSFNYEIDTFYILKHCINNNKTLCVPIIINDKMIASKITQLDNFKKNKYGILEPQKIEKINKIDIDLVIAPGLAFNTLGYRIGYGGGYYDNFLKNFEGMSIGMILKEFILTTLIPEEFDQPIKKLVTI